MEVLPYLRREAGWHMEKNNKSPWRGRSGCSLLDLLVWSPDGTHYAVPMNTLVDVFSVAQAGVSHTFHLKKKVTTIIFITDTILCIGEEDGSISAHSMQTGFELWRVSGARRVRGLAVHKKYLVAAYSAGSLTAYELLQPAEQPSLLTSIEIGCRLTCLTLCPKQSRKVKEEGVDGSREDGMTFANRHSSDDVSSVPYKHKNHSTE